MIMDLRCRFRCDLAGLNASLGNPLLDSVNHSGGPAGDVIYPLKRIIFQIICHAAKRFQRIGSLT
jgi:hypothetical protein